MKTRLLILPLLIAFAVATQGSSGCASSSSSSSSSSSASSGSANASDNNTPRVGPSGSVEVDDLRWRLLRAERATGIGDTEQGLGANANGEFVIATLRVTNHKSDTATLTDEVVTLVAAGKSYKVNSDAQTALAESGIKPLLLDEVGPDVDLTLRVGFDVPPSVLHEHPQLRFNELGFGTTHGYIALPRP